MRLQLQLLHKMQRDIAGADKRLQSLTSRLNSQNPAQRLAQSNSNLAYVKTRLLNSMAALLGTKKQQLASNASLLQSVSPLSTLARGYSITLAENAAVTSIEAVNNGDTITTRVTDGEITSTVTKTLKE